MATLEAIFDFILLVIGLIGIIPCFIYNIIYGNILLCIVFIIVNIFLIFKLNFNKVTSFLYLLFSYLSFYFYSLAPGVDGTFGGFDDTINYTFLGSLFALMSLILLINTIKKAL